MKIEEVVGAMDTTHCQDNENWEVVLKIFSVEKY